MPIISYSFIRQIQLCKNPIMRLRCGRNLNSLTDHTRLTGFTRFRCGRNLAADGTDSATRKTPLKSPNMPHDQAFLKDLVPTKALSFQKAVFVDLWLDSLGESTVRGTQGGEQFRIGCIGRGDVHLLLAACRLLNSLEMKPDVVV